MGNRWLLLVAALAASALAAGCDQPGATPQQQQKGPAALPSVTVSTPLRREVVEWDEYTGRFDAIETVEIRARVSGYLNEVHFKDGQTVKQGDLLFVIDPRPFERTLEQAQAELEQAKTRVKNANLDVTRGQPLLERRIISEKTFDDRENLVRDAQAAVKVARGQGEDGRARPVVHAHHLAADRAASAATRSSVGNWISAGGTASSTLLTTIVSQDPIHIYFDVSENNYIKYKRLAERGEGAGAADIGATVEIALPDERGYPAQGQARLPRQPSRPEHRHAAGARRGEQQVRAVLARPVRARAGDRRGAVCRRAAARRGDRLRPDQQVRLCRRCGRHGGAQDREARATA